VNNAEQIEYWNGTAGERWASFQPQLDAAMAAITPQVLSFALPSAGERVLDVGCGCGTTTSLLAQSVGPSGSVTGVDISEPMLKVARSRGINANFLLADAAVHRFKPSHDLIFSRFGVMFFSDPAAAFANLRSAVRHGGRLAFVCWGPIGENLWATLPVEAARPFLALEPPVDPYAPGPFAFADEKRLTGLLQTAGWQRPEATPLVSVMRMGTTLEDALAQSLRIGPLARAISELDARTRTQLSEAVGAALQRYQTSDGIALPARCWLVSARN
jgi:SAM-dependent methyltransferase